MEKERINISIDQEVREMLKELVEARHTTVSQLITDWTLEKYKEMKAWERLDNIFSIQGELEMAIDDYLESHPQANPAEVKRNPELLAAILNGYRSKTETELLEQGLLPVNDPDNPVFV